MIATDTPKREYFRERAEAALTAEVRRKHSEPTERKNRPLYTFEDQVSLAREDAPGVWRVPSSHLAGVRHRVDLHTGKCTCPGSRVLRHRQFCRHCEAVFVRLSRPILEIVGLPDAETLSAAISDLQAGAVMLSTGRYYNDNRFAKFGYIPSGRWEMRFYVGLREEVRGRTLTAYEVRACVWALTTLLKAQEQAVKAA